VIVSNRMAGLFGFGELPALSLSDELARVWLTYANSNPDSMWRDAKNASLAIDHLRKFPDAAAQEAVAFYDENERMAVEGLRQAEANAGLDITDPYSRRATRSPESEAALRAGIDAVTTALGTNIAVYLPYKLNAAVAAIKARQAAEIAEAKRQAELTAARAEGAASVRPAVSQAAITSAPSAVAAAITAAFTAPTDDAAAASKKMFLIGAAAFAAVGFVFLRRR
jgi:hypothetical protein